MAKGMKHYRKDGTEHKGGLHKMSNGQLHSGKTHTKSSKPLFDKYSPAQRRIAAIAAPRRKITGADFAVLRKSKKNGKKS